MARTRWSPESGSLLKAIDGSHLKWNVFREEVLQPFGIRITKPGEPNNVPPALLTLLEERLVGIERFDEQQQKWNDQLAIGQGFASQTVFPPNILPRVWSPTRVERFLSPKMTRETLPRRQRTSNCLYELPSSKPIYASAFLTEAFSELEHSAMPNSVSPSGTTIDFTKGLVGLGKILHCPFLVFERCKSAEGDDFEHAMNFCAISGAQCVRGLQEISQRAHKRSAKDVFTFTCLLNEKMATINIHGIDKQGKYTMSALCKFDLVLGEHFNTFQAWIEAIEDYATQVLLPDIKDCLLKISHAEDTPPASPMPSLTLSIDTDIGAVPGLIQTLRRTYPGIVWKGDEVQETPINSSIAHCGTPAEGRKAHSLALQTPSTMTFKDMMLRRGKGQSLVSPIRTVGNQAGHSLVSPNRNLPSYTPVRPSPFSPRYLSTAGTSAHPCDTIPESPCRPPLTSPYGPPPEQPWTAKSPMLVIQKRLDVALSEVQDLRHQVESLQSELAIKNQQFSERLASMEHMLKTQSRREDATAKTVHFEERNSQKVKQALHIEEDCDSEIGASWISFAWKHEGWDVLLEQLLFLVAIITLIVMVLFACRDLLPTIAQIPFHLNPDLSWLRTNPKRFIEWQRINRVQDLLPKVDVSKYIATWRSLD